MPLMFYIFCSHHYPIQKIGIPKFAKSLFQGMAASVRWRATEKHHGCQESRAEMFPARSSPMASRIAFKQISTERIFVKLLLNCELSLFFLPLET